MVFIQLFHGRKTRDEHMDDWGVEGPTFGPFDYIHTTYATDIKFGDNHTLNIYDEMVYYDGMFYGDWSVFSENTKPVTKFEQSKADLER